MYILVLNFGEKNVQKGGKGGGGHLQSKKSIANFSKLTHICKNKCNEELHKSGEGGVKGRLDFFPKNIHFREHRRP